MKTREIVYLMILGGSVLYCAKLLINASVVATSDAADAYYSILGWLMFLVGLLMYVGSFIAACVKLIKPWFDD